MKLKIKELREEYQLSQKELAEAIGSLQRNVSNWEKGLFEPDCETIVRLATFFHVSIDELFGFHGSELNVQSTSEREILKQVHRLSEQQKEALNLFIREMLSSK